VVADLLQKRWSPEQVAHELHVLFAGQPRRCLCTESIYQAIYDPAVQVTRPARRRRRRRRLLGVQRRGRLTAMRMIDERPVEASDRLQGGHWEGDLIMGKRLNINSPNTPDPKPTEEHRSESEPARWSHALAAARPQARIVVAASQPHA
jgi:IS30 family transposase